MSRFALLENFDDPDARTGATGRAGPTEDWLDGHAQGLADGLAQAAAAQSVLSAEIGQTLSDLGFSYAEARAEVLQSLGPLFSVLMARILPDLAAASHALRLVGLLQSAAEHDSARPVELSVHPDRIEGLAATLPYAVGLPVMLVADPSVGPNGAILQSARGETALDVDGMLAEATEALSAIFAPDEESRRHG